MKKTNRIALITLLALSPFALSATSWDPRVAWVDTIEFDGGPLRVDSKKIRFKVDGFPSLYKLELRVSNELVDDVRVFVEINVIVNKDLMYDKTLRMPQGIIAEKNNVFWMELKCLIGKNDTWKSTDVFVLDAVGQTVSEIKSNSGMYKGPTRYFGQSFDHVPYAAANLIWFSGFKREFDDSRSPCVDLSTYRIKVLRDKTIPITLGEGSQLELLDYTLLFSTGTWIHAMKPVRFWPVTLVEDDGDPGAYMIRFEKEYHYSASNLRMYEEKPDEPSFSSDSKLFFPVDNQLIGKKISLRLKLMGIGDEENYLYTSITALIGKNKIGSCDTSDYCVLTEGGRF